MRMQSITSLRKQKKSPLYLRAFYEWQGGVTNEISEGSKFILFGQKGTGKTAILRHLENSTSQTIPTSFVVFRKEIIEEANLANLATTFAASLVVDEEKIKDSKFYYHAMKRLLLTFLLSKCSELDQAPDDVSWFTKLYNDLKGSGIGQIAALVTDSVIGSIQSLEVDVGAISGGTVSVNASKAIKRSNDAFQKYAFEQFIKKNLRARIFLDEMHFAYRDTEGLSADASLVRDTILAVREINERLIENGIDALVIISVRSEFLEHQEIAVADVAHTIESYGIELSWENAPYDRNHPMFEMMAERLKVSLGENFDKQTMIANFIPIGLANDFLEYTWGKPRDIVRYFKSLKATFPSRSSIKKGKEYSSVIRRYSQAAWQDQKAALASFVPKNCIPKLEEVLQEISNRNFDNSKKYKKKDIAIELKDAFDEMVKSGISYDIKELIKLLYIVGVFSVRYRDAGQQEIIHQFHRGNRHPYTDGYYYVHRAVAKALS